MTRPTLCRFAYLVGFPLAALLVLTQPGAVVAGGPVVPGVAKVLDQETPDPLLAGRVLLGELQCLQCHKAPQKVSGWIQTKEAPKLENAGERLRPEWIQGYLENPAGAKPGTTMPAMLGHLPANEKSEKAKALTHFLASLGGKHQPRRLDTKLVKTGQDLYKEVGCAGCHGPRDASAKLEKEIPNIVSLGNLEDKYRYGSLVQFLSNPHATRPSGRMPSLLNGRENEAVAAYLLQSSPHDRGPRIPNVSFAAFEGDWDMLPDFSKMTPVRKGLAIGFDVSVASRENNVGIVFTSYFEVKKEGNYRFHLASDDGSSLKVDSKRIVNDDGVHPVKSASGRVRLQPGVHLIEVAIFQGGGEFVLNVEVEGPDLPRTDLGGLVRPTRDPVPPPPDVKAFVIDTGLAAKGKGLFTELGCIQCHALPGTPATAPPAAELLTLKGQGGCLGASDGKAHPVYGFEPSQVKLLADAIADLSKKNAAPDLASQLTQKMVALNCIGCHQRGELGGVEIARSPLFLSTQPEMGDEARIPPHLTIVGAKLQSDWLREVLEKGTKVRPYMLTRMPRYGAANVQELWENLPKVDTIAAAPVPKFSESEAKVKSNAKFLVGGKAFGCVKCHTFNGIKAEGVQGLDMVNMANRLNHDWFIAYMKNPSAMRPGTRMPASWPNGKTFFDNILGGSVPEQMEAVWYFLTLRNKAPIPEGLIRGAIQLVPNKEAIIYRNFIEGVGPRAIAVGYPEKASLAFDANQGRLAMIWQGPFIDAAKHWLDRGSGFQGPLGENIVTLAQGPGMTVLASASEPWPAKPKDYQFLGYKTTADERPTFLYKVAGATISDFPNAKTDGENSSLTRTIEVAHPAKGLTLLVAQSDALSGEGKVFKIGKDLTIKIEGAVPTLRTVAGKKELILSLDGAKEKKITIEYIW